MELYDTIGRTYTATRAPDPRWEARIHAALGDARTVVNVGAGTGSYEPRDREVVAVEPSEVMIAQRPPGSAPVVRAFAENLPFEDDAFDAAMSIFSEHHWRDRPAGLREMRRVARGPAVVLTYDPGRADDFWLTRDYLPEAKALVSMSFEEVARCLGATRIEPMPVPHDCRDGFYAAHWRRPDAYLDPTVRAGVSVFPRLPEAVVARAVERLRADLASGAWHERNRELLELDELDLGFRLLVAE